MLVIWSADLKTGFRPPLPQVVVVVVVVVAVVVVVPKASFFRSMAGGVPSGATEGSSMGPGRDRSFLFFRAPFLDPFSVHFFLICGPKNVPKIVPKIGPKIGPFLSSHPGLFS